VVPVLLPAVVPLLEPELVATPVPLPPVPVPLLDAAAVPEPLVEPLEPVAELVAAAPPVLPLTSIWPLHPRPAHNAVAAAATTQRWIELVAFVSMSPP
jgi:hypothetical protein